MHSYAEDKKFCHGSVISRDIENIYCTIKEKRKTGQLSHNNAELKRLWHYVMHSDNGIAANYSSEVILKLVEDKTIDINAAIETVVSLSATLKNVKWTINLVFKLLKLQFIATAKCCEDCGSLHGKSPYQLHFHTHPLIFILNSLPQSWNFIISEIQVLCFETKKSNNDLISISMTNIVEIFEPFFAYVFLNPSANENGFSYKVTLLLTLLGTVSLNKIQYAHSTCDHLSVISFLLNMLCLMKISEDYLQICNIFFSSINQSADLIKESNLITKFSFAILVGCHSSSELPISTGFSCLLHGLLVIKTTISEIGVFSLCLANLISQSHSDALPYLLECANKTLLSSSWLQYTPNIYLSSIFAIKASILQLILNKHCIGFDKHLSLLHKTLSLLDQLAASYQKIDDPGDEVTKQSFLNHNLWLSDSQLVFKSLLSFHRKNTLSGFSCLLKVSENIALNIKLVACGLFLFDVSIGSLSDKMYVNLINLLSQIASIYPQLGIAILPTLLYGIKNIKNLFKLNTLFLKLPKFVIDNNCISPILGAIQSLSQVKSLLPMAMQLMMKLWKKQERCFPYLHKMIIQVIPLCSAANAEITTVTAFVLKELCACKSYQNFNEILAMISTLLKKQIHPGQVVLLLDGIYFILSNQLVNIQSIWYELLEKISFSYNHDSITISILKILSLLPKFEVESPDFLKFKTDILNWIWQNLESSSDDVKGAMLVSLAHFKKDDLINMYLPSSLRPQLPPSAEEMLNEDFMLLPISGEDFIKVLNHVPMQVQAKYFCNSLLEQELQDMPRDIKDRAFRTQKQSSQFKVFSDLSAFVQKIYDKNKQPNLKAAFAIGVLMCYNPSLEESPKALVSLGRDVLQLLKSLIGEVAADGKNWKSLLWIVHAWKKFMEVCFKVMVKGRVAELNMQMNQKNADKEDIDHRLSTVDFWCRDKINELLKSTSKGTPTMQGNSFLALSGLFCALYTNKTTEQDGNHLVLKNCGYLSNEHWLGMAADTIFSAADVNYESTGRIFSWCQYKSVSRTGRLTTSKIGEVCALQAVKMMLPTMVSFDIDRLKKIMSILHTRVSNLLKSNLDNDQHETPVVSLHLNIVLGSLTAYLYQKKINESSDDILKHTLKSSAINLTKNAVALLNSNTKLAEDDDYGSDDDSEKMVMSYLSIAELLPALFSMSDSDLKDSAVSIFDSMKNCLESIDEQSGGYLEAFYFSFVSACIAGKKFKVLDDKTVASILTSLKNIYKENKNIPTTVALAHLCFVLKEAGNEQAKYLFKDLLGEFLKLASNQRLPTRQKLASINGLVALLGSELVFSGSMSEVPEKAETNLGILVKLLKESVQQTRDPAIASNSIMLLGHLYLSLQSICLKQTSSMPLSFSYLPKSSILKEMFSVLQLVEHSDCFQNDTTSKVVLHSIAEVSANSLKVLPPVNWEIPLSKILHFELNKNEQISCLKISLSQCLENETAAAFVSNCIIPSVFDTLHVSSQSFLLQNLHTIIQSSSSSNVNSLFSFTQSMFFNSPKLTLQQSFLLGIQKSLQLSSLHEKIATNIFLFLKSIIDKQKFTLTDDQLTEQWKKVVKCIAEYPDISHFKVDFFQDHPTKVLFIKCELLTLEQKSLQWLDQNIEACCLNENKSVQMNCLYILFKCLKKLYSSPQGKKNMESWMQDLLSFLLKSTAVQCSNTFLLRLFAICMMCLCKLHLTETYEAKTDDHLDKNSVKGFSLLLWDNSLLLLPKTVKTFLQKLSNETMSSQIIELLLHLYQNTLVGNQTIRNCLLLVFNEISHVPTLQMTSIWAKVASIVVLK